MKFHIQGVVLNVRDFVNAIRPILIRQIQEHRPELNVQETKALLVTVEEWVFKRLLDEQIGCDIVNFWRRDAIYESYYYALRTSYPGPMESDFSCALREAIPSHLIPNQVEVSYNHDCLIFRKADHTPWLLG